MNNTHELSRILTSLVEAWPEGHNHPTIDQAREYLESYHGRYSNAGVTDGHPMFSSEGDDYHYSLWYSL